MCVSILSFDFFSLSSVFKRLNWPWNGNNLFQLISILTIILLVNNSNLTIPIWNKRKSMQRNARRNSHSIICVYPIYYNHWSHSTMLFRSKCIAFAFKPLIWCNRKVVKKNRWKSFAANSSMVPNQIIFTIDWIASYVNWNELN